MDKKVARVKQENDSSQEPTPECSTACSPTDDDFSQQHYLIPGYNLIFIKEEEYVEQEAEGCSVESEPEMWSSNCSTSETANATEVGGLNAHSISPVEECTEPSVAGKKIKLYSCADCSYKTAWTTHLKRHIRKHTGEKPFSCELCEFKCAQSSDLKRHIRKHTGEKPFSCELCDYKCAQSRALKSHIRRHTGEKRFSCMFCDFKCVESNNLKKHVRRHTGEKPFSCEYCDYKSIQSSALKKHIRTHKVIVNRLEDLSPSRPQIKVQVKEEKQAGKRIKLHSCADCSYKTAWTTHLKRHIRKHTGEKPFSCELCEFKCAESSALIKHVRRHTGKKTFSCKYCDYKCIHSNALMKHIRTHKVIVNRLEDYITI